MEEYEKWDYFASEEEMLEIAKKALQHYEIAFDSLKMNPDYYMQECNMQKNIESGINKLEGLAGNNLERLFVGINQ